MNRLLLVLQLLSVTLIWPLQARATPQSPEAVVATTTEQVMQVLRNDAVATDKAATVGALEQAVMPHIDLQRISQRLLGDHWLSATIEQQKRFAGQFRTLLVKTYAAVLQQYTNAKIAYLPSQADPDANVATVKSRVTGDSGSPVAIDYRLRQQGGEWKLFDVALNGVSLLANYRGSFGKWVNTMGIDGLTDALAAHNR
jgi:phospholipid transport system substrate-binding protein